MAKDLKKTQHLTIYLVREEFTTPEEIVGQKATGEPFVIDIPGSQGFLYVKSESGITPNWVKLFQEFIDPTQLGTVATLSAVLLIKVSGRYFALTFGHGRHLVEADIFEERFGLMVVLNSVNRESIRVIDKQSLDAIQSHSRIQSGLETTADQFGLDVEQDMLRAIVGSPIDEKLGSRMTGADSLAVSVRMDLSDLPTLLRLYRKKFEAELHPDYAWVDNIKQVKKNSPIIAELDALVVEKLNSEDVGRVWLAIPEVIDWSKTVGFMFTNGKRRRYPDVSLKGFIASLNKEKVSVDLLRSRSVMCADEDNRATGMKWSVYKCIYAEIDKGQEKYVLNGGTWFGVDDDFVKTTNDRFAKALYSDLELPKYAGGKEGDYNKSVAVAHAKQYALLDADKIFHGGGKGQVEVCDLFSIKKEFIHIKRYGKSSVLSHLFSQGFVSGQLIQLDSDFRKKFKDKLKGQFASLVKVDVRPVAKEYSVIFAVISNDPSEKLNLPFFSRVNFNNTARILDGFGYDVRLLKIGWDEDYAATVTGPKAKKKKLV